MFKSVFAKYISAFILLILSSFLIIIAIVTSIIGKYSEEAKADVVATAANASALYLENKWKDSQATDLREMIDLHGEDLDKMLTMLSSSSDDLTVLLADSEGVIVMTAGSEKTAISKGEAIPAEFLAAKEQAFSGISSFSGLFDEPHLTHGVPLTDESGESVGTVFVCASSVMLSELLETIIKSIILAILWVMLAALIAIYFISEKVIAPLKEISRASKHFASGRFDVRVPVRGNDEVAELAIAFNNMAESLDNYETMRNTFISNVSHDLRTPVTAISGFVDGILDGVIPPDKQEYYLQIVSNEAKRLSRLVTSLLDVSRIQAGERKLTMSPFDICEMGREILISMEQRIDEKHLEVSFECEEENISVMADRDAIHQIFYNICDNAVKFSCEGGLLKISLLRQRDKKILVSVYNEGQGIPPADLPYVFERFYKSDKSRGLNKSGVGLGLFIAKTIIEAHKEQIWVESEHGKNCCFSFTLPQE